MNRSDHVVTFAKMRFTDDMQVTLSVGDADIGVWTPFSWSAIANTILCSREGYMGRAAPPPSKRPATPRSGSID